MIKKRIFKTKLFSKLTNKYEITDYDLSKAVQEIQAGLYEADLGGNVYKKRVAIGKSRQESWSANNYCDKVK